MTTNQDLEPLLKEPREDLSVEYKSWLNLNENEHRATFAKAAIALANHGGGYVVIGMDENGDVLNSVERPEIVPEITQDLANAAIKRFCDPEFHVSVFLVEHPDTGVVHPIISIPSDFSVPVMSKRDCPGTLQIHRCYIRKPGPRSEPPTNGPEWRGLLDRCVKANRDDLLDSIRTIMTGSALSTSVPISSGSRLVDFCDQSRSRWSELIETIPEDSAARFPLGYYEMGFSLNGAQPLSSLSCLNEALEHARSVRLTGWTPFLSMTTPEWRPYSHEQCIEAWIGRVPDGRSENRDYGHSDYWKASPDGFLYTIRGHQEDDLSQYPTGTVMDGTLPIWRVGEALLFASRFAECFEDVDEIGIYCKYTGLLDRSLVSVSDRRRFFGDHTSRTDSVMLEGAAAPSQLRDNLVEVLLPFLTPLYECFDIFRLTEDLVQSELANLRNRSG